MPRTLSFLRGSAILCLAAGAAACHGGSSSNTATNPQNAYGVWSGTDTGSGLALVGIVDSQNDAAFIRADGVLYAGTNSGQPTISVIQGALAAQMQGYSPFGGSFADGSTFGIGTLGGTVTTGKTLDGTWSFTTVANPTNVNSTAGTTTTTQWALNFESAFAGAPSLSTISGNYTDTTTGDPSEGAVLAISASGSVTAQAASTGCVLNGQVTATDTANQIYKFSYSYASCTGDFTVLNGIQFTGLGALNTKSSPVGLVIGVSGQSTSTRTSYGLALALTKS
jgi:hypothetical protein